MYGPPTHGAMNGASSDGVEYDQSPAWRILRVMSEFVDGFTFLAQIHKSVTIFGSARLDEGTHYYELARRTAERLAKEGYAIVTGGGPGIMQAGNQGASEAGGVSVGLNIQLPMEQRTNKYVTQSASFHYFFSRKVMLDFSAEAYIFFPGGYGTLDELFEVLTLIQTGKLEREAPVILVGRDFWTPLATWLETEMLHRLHTIAPDDLRIFTLTDEIDEIVRIVDTGVAEQGRQREQQGKPPHKTPDQRFQQATKPMKRTEQ